ncbi:MAG TPA: sulfotransferase [Polyangiales bacterium]|nr:sulfotransferase [Polyangiales bacterium]
MSDLELDAERLLADAVEQSAGLSDFGSGYRENLDALLEMYRGNARLSAGGRKSTRRRLLGLLNKRLQIARAFERAPEIRARKLERPMYIVGLPRTGTSALFNLLACDTASRPLLYWEGLHPEPGPSVAPGDTDPRLVQTRQDLERAYAKNPEFRAVHHVRADGPEECVALLAHTLGSVQMGIEPMISPYREYFERQDQRGNYRYYLDLLRLLDSQRPGRRWLLKSPAHLWALGPLVEQLPDACIVWTHRDPIAVVGSYCSMIEALSTLREGVDPRELGAAVLAYLTASVARAMRERGAHDPKRFIDVAHGEALRSPLAVVERVYDHYGLDSSAEDLARMRAYDAARAEPPAGQHRYDLERYGLRAEQVSEHFQDYARTFAPFLSAG